MFDIAVAHKYHFAMLLVAEEAHSLIATSSIHHLSPELNKKRMYLEILL